MLLSSSIIMLSLFTCDPKGHTVNNNFKVVFIDWQVLAIIVDPIDRLPCTCFAVQFQPQVGCSLPQRYERVFNNISRLLPPNFSHQQGEGMNELCIPENIPRMFQNLTMKGVYYGIKIMSTDTFHKIQSANTISPFPFKALITSESMAQRHETPYLSI